MDAPYDTDYPADAWGLLLCLVKTNLIKRKVVEALPQDIPRKESKIQVLILKIYQETVSLSSFGDEQFQ